MNENQKALEEFNKWAKKGMAESMESGHFPVAKIAIDEIDIKGDFRILDLSCGNAWALKYFFKKGIKTGFATDISYEMLVKAKSNLSEFKDKFLTLQSSINKLPFKENSFDLIFNMESFYYYENPLVVLEEINRVLKKDGYLMLLVDFYKENKVSMKWKDRLKIFMNPLSTDDYKKLLEKTGFKIEYIKRIISSNIRERREFEASESIQTYDEYLEFKYSGTLYILSRK